MLTLDKIQEAKTYLAERAEQLTATARSYGGGAPDGVSLPDIPLQKSTARGLIAGGFLTGAGLALLAVSLRRAATEEEPKAPRVRFRQDGAVTESSNTESAPTVMSQKLAELVERAPELVEDPKRVVQLANGEGSNALSKAASLVALPTMACTLGLVMGASTALALQNGGVPMEDVATEAAEEFLEDSAVDNDSEGDDG